MVTSFPSVGIIQVIYLGISFYNLSVYGFYVFTVIYTCFVN